MIGASIGLFMAAVLTQVPFIEKIITPYILLLVTTPTIALVPLLMLRMGFNIWPRIIAVALSVGPMVMINATTGFRRTDLAKIALAKSYGATTFQIFRKIRFPLALPMINVGLLVGGIFGLITAVASDMFGGKIGLGNRISYYSSLARMASFFAVILLVSLIGISIWIIMAAVGQEVGELAGIARAGVRGGSHEELQGRNRRVWLGGGGAPQDLHRAAELPAGGHHVAAQARPRRDQGAVRGGR